ncbi:RsmB/NOP family class I SAM-dependent RNA methyltransferase [Paenibacillus hodogayensis]|uniref:RsmB/NOP family class I SAM-dependent RNA methyltransferase n=2 Tax=Paenibacillus hodogayensis TaxID=279208 RepID=A0ABV5VXH3_9BACL
MAKLPAPFVQHMESLLQDEFSPFLRSYEHPRQQAIRVNGLKLSASRFRELSPFPLSPVAWAPQGFYIPEAERPGKHPLYHAGLYYVQEPSAMAPVELLDVRPGDKVLDLCAAPGGKSTQIASALQGQGLLVANDNQPDRVKALVKNIELYGVTNAIVLNETPERLAPALPQFFDKILVDAPCSGEGMFRKDESMVKSWDEQAPLRYAAMQRDILARAADMLKPGGRIVYSTCTFSPEENERTIAAFLQDRPDFRVVSVPLRHGFASGRPDWIGCADPDSVCAAVAGTVRLWPHRLQGEGHYVAVLERAGSAQEPENGMPDEADESAKRPDSSAWTGVGPGGQSGAMRSRKGSDKSGRPERLAASGKRDGKRPDEGGRGQQAADGETLFRTFVRDHLNVALSGVVRQQRDYVYLTAEGAPALDGLKAARPGWFVGTVHKDRFEPSHALAMGLKRHADAVRSISFGRDDAEAVRYVKGETLQLAEEKLNRSREEAAAKGYCLVCLEGYPLGWGKWQDGMLKNEYPPGWRWS